MNIELGDLKPGEYRMVTGEEYQKLLALVRDSSNLPASQAKHEKRDSKNRPIVQKERREKMENQMPQKARVGQETNKTQKRTDRKKPTGKRVYTVINGTEKK
jgi:hypothetical protein